MAVAVSELWLPHEQFPDAGDLLEWDEGSFGDGLLRLYWGPQFGPGSERILNQPEVISNLPGLGLTPNGGLPARTLSGTSYYTWEDSYRTEIKNQLTWFLLAQYTSTVNSFTLGDVQAEGAGYNHGLYVDSSGFPRFFVKTAGAGTAAVGSSSVASAGLALHVGTYDGTNIRLYFKGRLEGTAAKTGNVDTTAFATVLNRWAGAAGQTAGHFVVGGVANRCWSADEVQERALRFASVFGHRIWVPVSVSSSAVDGTASGATVTATASLIPGTATGQINATAAGVTLTVTSSLTAGAATGQRNATAAGQTLTATASLIAGSASGQANATASGQTLTATASLVPGTATGQQNATASGQTLTAAASLIPGTATGGNAGTAAGATLTATATLIPGTATGQQNATAPGVTLTAGVSLIAGSASAANDATASGVVIQAAASFIAGTATGNAGATAAGATMTATVTFIAGGAYGPTLTSTPGFRAVGRRPMFTARIGPDGRSLPRRRAS